MHNRRAVNIARRVPPPGALRALLLLALLAFAFPSPARAQGRLQTLRTRHYLIHGDLEPALLNDLGRRMDAMYAEYSRRLSDFDLGADDRPLDVYLFNAKQAYTDFTAGKYPNTGGIFMPARGQLAAYLEGQRDTLRKTLQHEAFHQFAAKAIGNNMPVWINEGLAQLFEEAIWTGQGFLMSQVPPRRLRQLQSDLRDNRLLPLKRLMSLTPQQWSMNLAADPAAGAAQYNQSWALVHYMAYGDNGANGVKLVKMLRMLSKGVEGPDAFDAAFGANTELFRVGFDRYVRSLAATTEAELIDRQEVLADLLAQLAERGRAFKDVDQFRKAVEQARYKLQYTRGALTWTAEPAKSFRDAQGRIWDTDELFFQPRKTTPLPDLVLKAPGSRIVLRARFYRTGKSIEREVLVEPTTATAGIDRD